MFDIGFWEMAFISIIALVVIGPEKLPAAAKTAGMWVGKARRMVGDVKADIKREMDENDALSGVKDLKNEISSVSKNIKQDIDDNLKDTGLKSTDSDDKDPLGIKSVGESIKSTVDDVSSTFKGAQAQEPVETASETSPEIKNVKEDAANKADQDDKQSTEPAAESAPVVKKTTKKSTAKKTTAKKKVAKKTTTKKTTAKKTTTKKATTKKTAAKKATSKKKLTRKASATQTDQDVASVGNDAENSGENGTEAPTQNS